MSNFNPSKEVLEKWTSTRKANKSLGDNFSHPRLFSTVGFAKDAVMFWIAMFIEITTLFVAVFFSGFNPILIIGALVLVALDLWFGANRLHVNEKHINKLQCKLELAKYEEKKRIKDSATSLHEQDGLKRSIAVYERKKIKFKIALLLIAALKAFFGFLILSPYGLAVALGVPALFFVAAYIHIENTGYYLTELRRRRAYNTEESKFIASVALNETSAYGIYEANFRPLDSLPKFDSVKAEFEQHVTNLTDNEKNEHRINKKNEKDATSKYLVLFGHNQVHKIVYDESSKNYYLCRWGNIQDDDLFEMIGGAAMTPEVKSYIGYIGLKSQYDDANIEAPKIPVK